MKHKEDILRLRAEGKTYNEIRDLLKCSKGTICYHCGIDQRQKYQFRRQQYRHSHPFIYKIASFANKTKKNIQIITNKRSIGQIIYQKLRRFNNNETLNMITIEQLLEKFGPNPKCYLTGKTIDINQPKTYQFDHIIPRTKGGDNSIENLGLTIKAANYAKHNLLLSEFVELCKQVAEHYK